ncbi:hypothetical protein ACJ41O_011474 [Fusarium nematophilum]
MLSHLRFHRRGPSNPASPCPDQHPTSPPTGHTSPFSSDLLSPDLRPTSSSSSALPPTLPPIARVTSDELGDRSLDHRQHVGTASQVESRPQQTPRSPYTRGSSFIGGVALRNYQRDIEAQAAETMDGGRGLGLVGQYSVSQPTLAPNHPPPPTRPAPQPIRNSKGASSFSTPTDLQNSAGAPTGRRPAGTRLVTELPSLALTSSNTEHPKPRKGLPFLKNPMSTLLMRRKNSQHVPDLHPLPLSSRKEEPMYDPRIKGTRVHDFSAPRPKKTVPSKEPTQPPFLSPVPGSSTLSEQETFPNPTVTQPARAPVPSSQRIPSNASESVYSQDSKTLKNLPSITSPGTSGIGVEEGSSSPGPNAPPVPPKDDGPISVQPRSPQASRLIEDNASIHARSSVSLRIGRSRGPSLSGMSGKDIPSALPRHMKSTSSRFSFDMIGAAKQEKLLEERHRQRELEKKTTEPSDPRDSRFDDFDDDAFDYDAMMDDDGFEEKIPGVNADYEDDIYEEEIPMVGDDLDDDLDPDNDQENFSGFVFQRSNPTSSLTSPRSAGFMPTPRDAEGNAIGFAMSQYTPVMHGALSPNLPMDPQTRQEMQPGGLGIQGLDVPTVASLQNEAAFQKNQQLPPTNNGRSLNDDDLYFDDGMMGLENEFAEDLAAPPEWDDTPFDESIFDNNDTDQFGRPIAGAFAQAQSQRQAAKEDTTTKRESDITSRFSAHSAASQSTAHTSLSVSGKKGLEPEAPKDSPQTHSPTEPSVLPQAVAPAGDSIAAYQAALAAAAHQAAASGKFQRGSSPVLDDTPLSEPTQSPDTPDHDDAFRADDYDGYDDYNESYEDMADFELDDDAIIAEANASALANDCDGWYGQEFGFYSTPVSQQHHGSTSTSIDYEYANGGFFGPKGGLDRTTSGRMVSREPNLTPITERSEYSNRNSIMSLGMPGFGSGTPLQSPGLAQLALMGDRGDEMSLSALLRLRSRAWGGSQVSLASSQNGSPRSERGDLAGSPWGPNFSSPTTFHARKNSVLSTVSQDSENCSVSGSPTLTGGIPGLASPPPPVPPLTQLESDMQEDAKVAPLNVSRPTSKNFENGVSPLSDPEDSSMPPSTLVSPVEPSNCTSNAGSNASPQRPGMGHRHKSSADSISYMKEEDSGATRWVIERRRTGESGQEILEREVVEGGRI